MMPGVHQRAVQTPAALEIRGLRKNYGPNIVLNGVDFDLRFGEIHALLGENGAGKSTLIKILAGAVTSDGGTISVCGVTLPPAYQPEDIFAFGVAFVHQHLGLFEDLSVAENIALVAGYKRNGRFISHRDTEKDAAFWLKSVGASFGPSARVGDLGQDEKVLCAVARALATKARIIVLDEVSASLPGPEMDRLAKMLLAAKLSNIAYIYVTHRLPEVFQLADTVTVLRDGCVAACMRVQDTEHDEIVRHILGKEHIVGSRQPEARQATTPSLEVRGITGKGLSQAISFAIAPGEILGVCGLVGSGMRALARLLGGAQTPTGGEALLDGVKLPLGDATALAAHGCAYIPGDRENEGVLTKLTIRENLFPTSRVGDGLTETRLRWPVRERAQACELIRLFDVRPPGNCEKSISELSGGNQQKVVFGRALRTSRKLLVLEDPTAGVDIGSREALYALMRQAAQAGAAVLLVSSNFEEVATQSDRALVMREGRAVEEIIVSRLNADDAETQLAHASYRGGGSGFPKDDENEHN